MAGNQASKHAPNFVSEHRNTRLVSVVSIDVASVSISAAQHPTDTKQGELVLLTSTACFCLYVYWNEKRSEAVQRTGPDRTVCPSVCGTFVTALKQGSICLIIFLSDKHGLW